MERLLTGLADFLIKKFITLRPAYLEVLYNQYTYCPECHSPDKRIKASSSREGHMDSETLKITDYGLGCYADKSI